MLLWYQVHVTLTKTLVSDGMALPGWAYVVVAAVCWGSFGAAFRLKRLKVVHPVVQLFYLTLGCLVASAPLVFIAPFTFSWFGCVAGWLWVCGTLGH